MAESPSELQAEIEKLERKHAENPEGRYFVPLANDYRKIGDIERAEGLLREGLRKHPDYLSAHIVLGRCLADRDRNADAADEFRYVLSMDPQNLIALRSLGELALADGRRDDAARWYRELLAVDPMNDEARQALAELEAPQPAAPAGTDEGGAWWDSSESGAASDQTDGAGVQVGAGTDLEHVSGPDIGRSPGDAEAPVGGSDSHEPDAGDGFGRSEDSRFGEFLDLDDGGANEVVAPAHRSGDGDSYFEGGGSESLLDEEVESVEVVTETIAELYARQGLHERAADVYRELIRRRGGDAVLEQRLADLERAAAGDEERSPAAGEAPSDAAADFLATADQGFGDLELESSPDDEAGAAAGLQAQGTGDDADPFADSFTTGFSEQPARGGEQEWGDELAAPGFDRTTDSPEAAPVADVGATNESGSHQMADGGQDRQERQPGRGGTIAEYLASIAAWRPAASSAQVEPHPGASASVASEQSADYGASAPDQPHAADELPDDVEDLERGGMVVPEAVEPEPAGADLFPWELPADEEPGPAPASAAPASDRAPVRQDQDAYADRDVTAPGADEPDDAEVEPMIGLDDYFPADADQPEPTPSSLEAPALPPEQPGGETDEDEDDLESFQAWLRSLKR